MRMYNFETVISENGTVVLPEYIKTLNNHKVRLTLFDLENPDKNDKAEECGSEDANMKTRYMADEYLCRFAQYRRTDISLTQKYGMSFDEFVKQRVVCNNGYSWESESDAMNWEAAISGMNTIDNHLSYLRKNTSHV